MIYFISLLAFVIANRLTITETKTFYDSNPNPYKFDLVLGENKVIHGFGDSKYAISAAFNYTDEERPFDICYTKQGMVAFSDYTLHSQKIFESTYTPNNEHVNDPSYFLSTPVLLKMVHTKQGIAIVTSDHQILLFTVVEDQRSQTGFRTKQVANASFDHLRSDANENHVPHLIYAPYTEYIYIIYPNQVIGGKADAQLSLRNITLVGLENDHNYIGQIKVHGWLIYVPVGSDGLDVYKYEESGNLRQISTLTSFDLYNKSQPIFIVDVTIGSGEYGIDYLYILDQNFGVTRFIRDFNDSACNITRDTAFGYVDFANGITFKENQNNYLVILCEKGFSHYLVEIGLHRRDWFVVRIHNLDGRYFEIVTTRGFVILRGKDEHRVIRPGVYEQFELERNFDFEDDYNKEKANSYFEQYFTIPKLQSLEFYSIEFGIHDPDTWHFNETHPFILGLTSHSLIELPYFVQGPYIICNTKSKEALGLTWHYNIDLKTTWCGQKYQLFENETYIQFGELSEQMVACIQTEKYEVTVVSGDAMIYNTEELVSITIGLIILLVLLSFLLAYLYSKFKVKEEELTPAITGFDSNREYQMEPNDNNISGL